MKTTFILTFVICSLASCENGPVNFEGGDPSHYSVAKMMSPPRPAEQSAPARKLIKTGALTLTVENAGDAQQEIEALCKRYGGYISSETQTRYGERIEFNQNIRIPSNHFDVFVKELEALGQKVTHKNIESVDVTEEFIDNESRIKTKKELESRYREILRQAKSVSDILSIEAQLNHVRADIESMEGRLNYLKNQVEFSTLTLAFYEPVGIESGFGSKIVAAFGEGWELFLILIVGLMGMWPFLLLGGVILIVLLRKGRFGVGRRI